MEQLPVRGHGVRRLCGGMGSDGIAPAQVHLLVVGDVVRKNGQEKLSVSAVECFPSIISQTWGNLEDLK